MISKKTFRSLALYACFVLPGCSDDPTRPVCPPYNPIGSSASSPTWSPDCRLIAFHGSSDSSGTFAPGVYLTDTTASSLTKLLDTAGKPFSGSEMSWSPDGSRIAMYYEYDIWTIDVADRTMRKWTSDAPDAHYPQWSPDGRYLLYLITTRAYNEPDSASGLHIIDTVDGTQRALMRNDSLVWGGKGRWSPDGLSIVFVTALNPSPDGRYGWDIVTVPPSGRPHRLLAHISQGFPDNAQWSADGSQVFFDFTPAPCPPGQSANRSTWVVSADGTGLRQWPVNLGDSRVQFGFPFELSRVGQRTTFIGLDSTGTAGVLTVMNLDGSGRKELTRPLLIPRPG
jgi:Tol biopolymer transport system component